MASSVPMDVLLAFHKMEREIFCRLVLNMLRDPYPSMQLIALWLWIERIGFPNIIQKMLELPDRVLNMIAEEGEVCLRCLHSDIPPPTSGENIIPITSSLVDQQPFSLQLLYERRHDAIQGMRMTMDDVCSRIFDDIMQRVAERVRDTICRDDRVGPASRLAVNMGLAIPRGEVGPMMGSPGWIRPHQEGSSRQGNAADMLMMMGPRFQPFFHPGPPNVGPMVPVDGLQPLEVGVEGPRLHFDPFHLEGDPQEWSIDIINDIMGAPYLNPRAKPWAPDDELSQGDRTMFLTFSRGYPLSQEEIREFFFKQWGDCIQCLYIQETPDGVQPLFARLVLYSPATVPLILQGQEKAKFVIKGKHVWVRPYIPKKNRAHSPA